MKIIIEVKYFVADFGGKVRPVIRGLSQVKVNSGEKPQPQVLLASILGANGKWIKGKIN